MQIYGDDFIAAYRQKLLDSPHVYAIADAAYNEMMRGVFFSSFLSEKITLAVSNCNLFLKPPFFFLDINLPCR